MTAADLVERLHARRSGSGWEARCPAHDDQRASLSISESNGRTLVYCHAGCTVGQVVVACGLEMRDLFTESAPSATHARRGRITVEDLAAAKGLSADFLRSLGLEDTPAGVRISYSLMDGTPAPRQRIRTALAAKQGSRWSGEGPILPYGLERLASARKSRMLVLVEGESDCWALWFHQVPALGLPGATMAGHLQVDHLAGITKVFVLREPDAGGSTFIQRIARRLAEIKWDGEARVFSLAPHKDAADLHSADPQGFGEKLQAAFVAAETLQVRDDASPWSAAEDVATFLAGDDSVGFLEEPVLARGCLTEMFSPRGLGKSLYALWLAMKLATVGRRVLYIDRDNPCHLVRQRLRGFGVDENLRGLEIIGRDAAPPLTNSAKWAAFPYERYDVVILDSLDASTEGVGEQDSAKPSLALAPLLDVCRHENGPAVVVLGNTVRTGRHSRGSGVVEDRADIVFEVRDATGLQPSGSKLWWEELPDSSASAWSQRAARRKGREKFRLAFIPSKFRVGAEPEPFAVEIDLTADPWAVGDVTAEIDAIGAAAVEARKRAKEEAVAKAVAALSEEILRREQAGGEGQILKTQAEAFLVGRGIKRNAAREAVASPAFQIVEVGGKGRPKVVRLAGKNQSGGRNDGPSEGLKILGKNDADFCRTHEQGAAEVNPSEATIKPGFARHPISATGSIFTPPKSTETGPESSIEEGEI